MWKIILLSVILVTINANIEEFAGQWTPVALYPSFIFMPLCLQMSFAVNPENLKCTCEDGKKTDLLEVSLVLDGKIVEEGKKSYPALVVEDVNEVTSSLYVTCTCGNKEFPTRVVVKSASNNYFVMYKPQNVTDKEPNAAMIYARQVPSFQSMLSVMKSITDLSTRAGGVLCSSELLARDLLSKAKHQQNKQR